MQTMFLIRERGWILAFTSMVTACLPNPATGVASSGEPLLVQYRTGTGTYVSDDKTGEDVTTHGDGSQTVTDHYTAVQHAYQWSDRRYFQGATQLDEEDYFRIAGDDQAVRTIEDIRRGADKKMKIGMPLLVLGAVAGVVLTLVGSQTENHGLSTGAYIGGAAVGLTGWYLWHQGRATMATPFQLPPEVAVQHAAVLEDCDQGRCRRRPGPAARPTPPLPPLPPPPPLGPPPPRKKTLSPR